MQNILPGKILILFNFILLITFSNISTKGVPTTYYINSKQGNDNNSGISKNEPFKSLVKLEQDIFKPGDSILFACGSEYKGGFIFECSGNKDNPIVIASYSTTPELILSTPRNKLDSLFEKHGAGPPPSFSNSEWNILAGNIFHIKGSYVILESLYFHDNTYPPGSDRINKNVQKMGAVYLAPGADNCIIRNCEFYNTPVAIKIKSSHNTISHNYFHDATGKLAYSWGPIAIMITKPYNEICYNRIINYGSYGGPYGSDGGAIELDGVDDDFNGRAISIHHNVSINNNGFLELAGNGIDSILVAYNLSDDKNQFLGGGSMKNIFVFNNTIVRLKEPNVDRFIFWTFKPASTHIIVRNNIFILPEDISVFGPYILPEGHQRARIGNQPHDHNLYFSVSPFNKDPLGSIKIGENDIIADPLFIDPVNGNFRLKKNSPARNAGAKLGFTHDIDGRIIKGKPDIGAYEY